MNSLRVLSLCLLFNLSNSNAVFGKKDSSKALAASANSLSDEDLKKSYAFLVHSHIANEDSSPLLTRDQLATRLIAAGTAGFSLSLLGLYCNYFDLIHGGFVSIALSTALSFGTYCYYRGKTREGMLETVTKQVEYLNGVPPEASPVVCLLEKVIPGNDDGHPKKFSVSQVIELVKNMHPVTEWFQKKKE